jgi:hypothetical protein
VDGAARQRGAATAGESPSRRASKPGASAREAHDIRAYVPPPPPPPPHPPPPPPHPPHPDTRPLTCRRPSGRHYVTRLESHCLAISTWGPLLLAGLECSRPYAKSAVFAINSGDGAVPTRETEEANRKRPSMTQVYNIVTTLVVAWLDLYYQGILRLNVNWLFVSKQGE